MPKLASIKSCTGCLSCADTCNHNAIAIILKNGHPYVTVNKKKCIECGLCEKSCPIVTPVETNHIKNMRVYGGWAKNEKMRINAASGGGFSALASSFIEKHKDEKVAIYGATLINNRVKHISIENEEDIQLLANSKYIQSDTKGIYKDVAKKLKDGYWIMFSGCPCQISALYSFLGKKRNNEHLVTVEVVCHGVANNEALDIHLKYYNSDKIISFRDKKNGSQIGKFSQSTTINIKGKETKIPKNDDIFYKVYTSWLLDRKCCSNCTFARLDRVADITLADFWGLSNIEYYKKGVSLIISNNIKGDNLIQDTDTLDIFKESIDKAINGNPHLYIGYKFIQWHPIVLWPNFFRKILSERVRFNILTNRMPYKLFWALFKIATIYLTKYRKRLILKKLYRNKETRHLLNIEVKSK